LGILGQPTQKQNKTSCLPGDVLALRPTLYAKFTSSPFQEKQHSLIFRECWNIFHPDVKTQFASAFSDL